MIANPSDPIEIVKEKGWLKINDVDQLSVLCKELIEKNAEKVSWACVSKQTRLIHLLTLLGQVCAKWRFKAIQVVCRASHGSYKRHGWPYCTEPSAKRLLGLELLWGNDGYLCACKYQAKGRQEEEEGTLSIEGIPPILSLFCIDCYYYCFVCLCTWETSSRLEIKLPLWTWWEIQNAEHMIQFFEILAYEKHPIVCITCKRTDKTKYTIMAVGLWVQFITRYLCDAPRQSLICVSTNQAFETRTVPQFNNKQ